MSQVKDMTGQTINGIYIESRAENDRDGRAMFNCICFCGNRFVANGKNLRNGNTTSCGCKRIKTLHDRCFVDLVGSTFNYLFVDEYIGSHKQKNVWGCTCLLCGAKTTATTDQLMSGSKKSCGCLIRQHCKHFNYRNLVGEIYNWLKVREYVGNTKHGSCIWLCECLLCGGLRHATTTDLTTGRVKSCGCLNSHGENIIRTIFEKWHITFQRQKKFIGCVSQNQLMFDYYLPDYNVAIEYDGEMHYKVTSLGNDLEAQQSRDKIKDQYCEENDIILLRIPYWEKDNIESILIDRLFLNDADEANSSDVDLSA